MKKILFTALMFIALMSVGLFVSFAQDNQPTPTPDVIFVTQTPVSTEIVVIPPIEPTAEATVEPTPAPEPAPVNWFTTVSPWVVILLIVIAVAVATLGHTAIVQLGASVPVAFWEIGKGAVVSGLDQLGGYVTTTPTAIDNEAYTELRKQFDALVKEVATLRQTQAQNISRISAVEVTTQALK